MDKDKFYWSKINPKSETLRDIVENSVNALSEKLINSITKETRNRTEEHLKYMKKIIQKGANINYINKEGHALLCEATLY